MRHHGRRSRRAPQAAKGGADPGPDPTPAPEVTPTRRARRRLRLALGAAVLLWLATAGTLLIGARASAQAGMAELDAVRAGASTSGLLSGSQTAGLRRAEGHFDRARARLRSVPVSPLRALPVVGRQLRSADALARAAGEVADAGGDALDEATALVEGGAGAGPARARLVADLSQVVARAHGRVAAVDLGPGDALVGPLARARAEAVQTVEELESSLGRAEVATAGLAELLGGSSRYLLLVSNNAEMRAGSGMFLTAGPMTITDGHIEVGPLEPTSGLLLAESVPLPADLAGRWGWLAPGREWRNLGVSPRFDVTAPLAADMWEAARGERVDGVLAVDVIALRALLSAVGPIEVEGKQLDAANVEQDLFREQYVGLSYDDAAQAGRSGRLAAVAQGAVAALDRPDLDLAKLAGELTGAARGRHLMAWVADPTMQSAWEAAGLDGALDADDLLLAVLNRGGNKLDPYLQVDADLVVVAAGDVTEVSIDIRLSNAVPDGLAPYVLGPDPSLDVAPGTYVGLVSATLPGEARAGRFDGANLAVAGRDGSGRVVAAPVTVLQGDEHRLTLRFELPAAPGAMDVLPGARVPPTLWHSIDNDWAGDHAERVEW